MLNEEGFSIRSLIFKVILVAIFIVGFVWLFPMPNMKPVYDRIFTENIQTMKDAAKSYFTKERLPQKVGDTIKLSLAEMQSKKLVVPFLDSDDKSCDLQASYVEIVKMENEYLLKANLSCSSKTDYMVEHIGCYGTCATASCNTQEPPKQEEPQKQSYNNNNNKQDKTAVYEYEYSRQLYKGYKTVDTKVTEYEQNRYENKVTGYTYACARGTLNSKNQCVLKTTSDVYTNAQLASYTTTTVKGFDISYTYTNRSVAASTTQVFDYYKCPTNYSLYGSKCTGQVQDVTYGSWYYNRTAYSATTMTSMNADGTEKREYMGTEFQSSCSTCYDMVMVNVYKIYTRTKSVSSRTETIDATPVYKTAYTCSQGYLSGSNCIISEVSGSSYYCSSGTMVSNGCQVTESHSYYYCSTGTLTGSSCKTTKTTTSYPDVVKTPKYEKTLVDTKWTTERAISGWEATGKSRESGSSNNKVYSEWSTSLPAGYNLYDKKTEYTWSKKKVLDGWTATGKTIVVYI